MHKMWVWLLLVRFILIRTCDTFRMTCRDRWLSLALSQWVDTVRCHSTYLLKQKPKPDCAGLHFFSSHFLPFHMFPSRWQHCTFGFAAQEAHTCPLILYIPIFFVCFCGNSKYDVVQQTFNPTLISTHFAQGEEVRMLHNQKHTVTIRAEVQQKTLKPSCSKAATN